MIVCSKRVYLNAITQLYPAEVLVNANYYLPDTGSSKRVFINNSIGIDSGTGEIVRKNRAVDIGPDPSVGPYHITIDGSLDIGSYIVTFVVGSQSSDEDPVSKFIKRLNTPEVMWNVYKAIFRDPLKGNGMQFLVYEDHKSLWKYGHIICQYLSYNFGCDITFIDKAVVGICEGYTQYVGNKAMGIKTIKDINDWNVLKLFHENVSKTSAYGSESNIDTYLGTLQFNDLMYLYNLLYPEAPLPPGNYEMEQIRGIIKERALANLTLTPKNMFNDENVLNNIMIHNWQSVVDEFENASVEEIFDEYPGDDSGLF